MPLAPIRTDLKVGRNRESMPIADDASVSCSLLPPRARHSRAGRAPTCAPRRPHDGGGGTRRPRARTDDAQRLVRAKRKIRLAASRYRVPPERTARARPERGSARALPRVQRGYLATEGDDLVRGELCDDASISSHSCATHAGRARAARSACVDVFHHARQATRVATDGSMCCSRIRIVTSGIR